MAREKAGSVELATGYISMTVKYKGALEQIRNDLRATEAEAQRTGARAGSALGAGVAAGSRGSGAKVANMLDAEIGATTGERIGRRLGTGVGKGLAYTVGAPVVAARKMGSKIADAFSLGFNPEALIAAAGIGSVAEILKSGFEEHTAIDAATKRLQILGLTAEQVHETVENAEKATAGTSVELGDALGVAMKQIQTGIKPGEELETRLRAIGDASALTGRNLADMGLMFQRADIGRFTARDLRSMPILVKWLETYYKTDEAGVNKMIKNHQISGDVLTKITEQNIGGAAPKIDSSTVSGALGVFKKSIKEFGGHLWDPIWGDLPGIISKASGALHGIIPAIHALGAEISKQPLFKDILKEAKQLGTELGPMFKAAEPIVKTAFEAIGAVVGGGVGLVGDALLRLYNVVVPIFTKIFELIKSNAPSVLHAFENIGHAFENVGHAAGNVGHAFGNFWHAIENIGHAFSNVGHAVMNVVRFFAPFAEIIGKAVWMVFKTTAEGIWHGLENVAGAVGKVFEWIGKLLEPIAKPAWNAFKDVVGEIWKGMQKLAEWGEKAWNWIDKMAHSAGGFLSHLGSSIMGAIPGGSGGGVIPGHAQGTAGIRANMFYGPGTGTSDSILGVDAFGMPTARVSVGEGIIKKKAMDNPIVKMIVRLANSGRFDRGGIIPGYDGGTGGDGVGADVTAAGGMVGTPYSTSGRTDCSGDVGSVINQAMGLPNGSLPTTANMGQWLAARGFQQGMGGLGDITVGWYNGSGPGGGHAAMTLSNGMPAEGGGAHGGFLVGSGAAGADNPEFTNHMFIKASAIKGEGDSRGGAGFGGIGGGGGSDSGGGGTASPLSALGSSLGSIATTAFGDNLPQGFSNPLEWPDVKSLMAGGQFLFGMLGSQSKDPSTKAAMKIMGGISGLDGGQVAEGIGSLARSGASPGAGLAASAVGGAGAGGLGPGLGSLPGAPDDKGGKDGQGNIYGAVYAQNLYDTTDKQNAQNRATSSASNMNLGAKRLAHRSAG
jgi:hypothetical protein